MASESKPGADESAASPPEAVVIKTFHSSADAEMAAAILRANNIPVWLHADDCGGMYPFMDTAEGVKLLAHSGDAETAKALLAATPLPTEESVSGTSAPPVTAPRTKLGFAQIAVGMVVGVLLCLLYQYTSRLGTHRYRYDDNGDGVADQFMVYRDGRCVEQSFDRDFNRTPDLWYYYDAEGRRAESKADDNFDGRIDGVWFYTNGVLAEARLDTDFNSTTDVTQTFHRDLLKQAEWRPNGSRVTSLREFFRHGMLIEEWRDTNMDGVFDITNHFDAFQNRIETNTFKRVSNPQL